MANDKPLYIPQIISMVVILGLLAISYGWYSYYGEDEQGQQENIDLPLEIKGLSISLYDSLGLIESKGHFGSLLLRTNHAYDFKDVLLYNNTIGEGPFLYYGEKAFYKEKTITTKGASRLFTLVPYKGFEKAIFADSIYDFKLRTLTSQKPVELLGRGFKVNAQRFTFDLAKDFYQFHDAKTTYLINSK